MDSMFNLTELQQEIMARADDTIEKALHYQRAFDSYAHLWLNDKATFMRHFLLYGYICTTEDVDACRPDSFQESQPTIEQFKDQVNNEHHLICFSANRFMHLILDVHLLRKLS